MAEKEPVITQPDIWAQRIYQSIESNDADEVGVLRTKKKYRIRWLKNGQIVKLSRLLLRKNGVDREEAAEEDLLGQVISDNKLACKAAAIYTLDGFWKIKFLYWFRWRWFYYIRQYDSIQLDELLEMGKKKVPLMQYYKATISLIGAKGTLMQMRTEEAEAILRALDTEQRSQTESKASGS